MDNLLCLSLLFLACSHVWGYDSYVKKIPNGDNVPHPCMPGYWGPIGHVNPDSLNPGQANQFGIDFKEMDKAKWREDICQADSDGDGRSNGEELGDPDCTWKMGSQTLPTDGITHPGICEPIDTDYCIARNTFLVCSDFLDGCPVTTESDVETIDFTLPSTIVPNEERTSICMTFDLPTDQDYHIVAFKPIIESEAVLHHMILYGCPLDVDVNMTQPGSCEMPAEENSCSNMMYAWTVGETGRCYGEDIGFRIGTNGTRRVLLEVHWYNPNLEGGIADTSGLRAFYTPAGNDVHDLGFLMTGQTMLKLPPGQSLVNISGGCNGGCTSTILTQNVYVLDVLNHMHYLGQSMKVEVYRNGTWVVDLSNDEMYDYNDPVLHQHSQPIELEPGDEIRTNCVYNSTNSTRWVFFGLTPSDEMCLAFLVFYPAAALTDDRWCTSLGPLTPCDLDLGTPIGDCNWAQFVDFQNSESAARYAELERNCNLGGYCRPECQETVDEIQQHACLQGEAGHIVKELLSRTHEGSKHLSRIYSCPNCSQPEIILSTPTYPSCGPASSLQPLQTSLESFSLQPSEAFYESGFPTPLITLSEIVSLPPHDYVSLPPSLSYSLPPSLSYSLPPSLSYSLPPILSYSLSSVQNISLSSVQSVTPSRPPSLPPSRPTPPPSSRPPPITPSQTSSATLYSSSTQDFCNQQCSRLCSITPPDNGAQNQRHPTWAALMIAIAVTTAFFWEYTPTLVALYI